MASLSTIFRGLSLAGALLLVSGPLSVNAAAFELVRRDLTVPTVDGWDYQGCWIDSVGNRTLQNGAYNDGSDMTIEKCLAFCSNGGYSYGGVEYAGQCYCSRALLADTTVQNESDCNMACTGDATEPCGGSNRLNLFKAQTYNGPKIAPGSSGFTYSGCFNDSVAARTLSKQLDVSSLTVESCLSACSLQGFKYAGVEYSRECYCGNTLDNYGAIASDGETQCNMVCDGNKLEYCGGSGRLNLYKAAGTGSTGSTGSAASTNGLPTNWASQGCFTDSAGARGLANFIGVTGGGDNMTVEGCVNTCAGLGYSIAGLEYSGECWCDTKLNNGIAPATDGCYMPCHGNSSEVCGGPNRLSVYANSTLFTGIDLTKWYLQYPPYGTNETHVPQTTGGPNAMRFTFNIPFTQYFYGNAGQYWLLNMTTTPGKSYDLSLDVKVDEMSFRSCSASAYVDNDFRMNYTYTTVNQTTFTTWTFSFQAFDPITSLNFGLSCNPYNSYSNVYGFVAATLNKFTLTPRTDSVNFLQNPGFEASSTDYSPWTYTPAAGSGVTSFSLSQSLNVISGNNVGKFSYYLAKSTGGYNYDALRQTATGLIPGQAYTARARFWLAGAPGTGATAYMNCRLSLKDPNASGYITQYPVSSGTGNYFSIKWAFTAPSSSVIVELGIAISNPSQSQTFYTTVDDVLLMPGSYQS